MKGLTVCALAVTMLSVVPVTLGTEKQLYEADFDSFFSQEYDLTLRDYNTFSSVAGSQIAPADSRCVIMEDPLNGDNSVLKMGNTKAVAGSGFNTFFVRYSRLPSRIAPQGGALKISFDFYPEGWNDTTVVPLDKKLFFSVGGKGGQYFVAADKSVISEPNANAVENYSEFEDSALTGYRRITFETQLSSAETVSDALTFWFYNAMGKTTAYLDNFSVTYCDVELIAEGSFESFDLTTYACPNVAETSPLKNYGVSARSALSEYSPAKVVRNAGVRFAAGQGVFSNAQSGTLVDFTIGGEQIFPSAGLYKVSADVLLVGDSSAKLDLELNEFSNPSSGRTGNLFGNGGGYYEKLSASVKNGEYRRIEYTLSLTESEAEKFDCLSFVFDTGGESVLFLDRLSIAPQVSCVPEILWTSGNEVDRGTQSDFLIGSNFGEIKADVSIKYGNTKETVSPLYYKQIGNTVGIDYRFFNLYKADGTYVLCLETPYGTAETSVLVRGDSGLPEAKDSSYKWYRSGDLRVSVNLKGAKVTSVENDGITLNSREYAVTEDGSTLILREGYLDGLTSDGVFRVSTTKGEFFFTVIISEQGSGLSAWEIGAIAAASVIVLAGTAVGAVFGYKHCKRKKEGKSND